jgi:hypothetical protein
VLRLQGGHIAFSHLFFIIHLAEKVVHCHGLDMSSIVKKWEDE